MKISQNYVAFLEYMNFNNVCTTFNFSCVNTTIQIITKNNCLCGKIFRDILTFDPYLILLSFQKSDLFISNKFDEFIE